MPKRRDTTWAPGGNPNAATRAGQEQPRPLAGERANLANRNSLARRAINPERKGMGRGKRYTLDRLFVAAFREQHGSIINTALVLGVTRQSVYKSSHPSIRNCRNFQIELLEKSKDFARGSIRHLALEELNVTANLAFLNAKVRNHDCWSGRGDINAQSTNLPPGETHYHLHLHGSSGSRLASLSNDELRARIAQRRAELAAPDPDRDRQPEPAGLVEIIPPDRPARQAQPQPQLEPDDAD